MKPLTCSVVSSAKIDLTQHSADFEFSLFRRLVQVAVGHLQGRLESQEVDCECSRQTERH